MLHAGDFGYGLFALQDIKRIITRTSRKQSHPGQPHSRLNFLDCVQLPLLLFCFGRCVIRPYSWHLPTSSLQRPETLMASRWSLNTAGREPRRSRVTGSYTTLTQFKTPKGFNRLTLGKVLGHKEFSKI